MQRIYLFSSLLPNQTVGSYSSRHNYRTDPKRRATPPTREGRNTTSHKKSKEEEAAPLKGGRERRGDGATTSLFFKSLCFIFLDFVVL